MSDDPSPMTQPVPKLTLGDRIRGIANQLRQENDVQIKATSRILGAAAQIAQNHDHLIDEVVEMVQEDLSHQPLSAQPKPYTVEQLQRQFKTLKEAKVQFGIKAGSWAALVAKLNEPPMNSGSSAAQPQESLVQRLEAIECEVKTMRGDINQVLTLLNMIAEKLL